LQQLEGELKVLRETMLRISGAIQVLEEIQQSDAAPKVADNSNGVQPQEKKDGIAASS
jgi:hypothetical protein